MLKTGLKATAKALSDWDRNFETIWPGDLDEGLTAMVMGWKAFESSDTMNTPEMIAILEYLEADCQALWNILRWLRWQGEATSCQYMEIVAR